MGKEDLKRPGMKKCFCPTRGMEGVIGPHPAGEICPYCGKEKGKGAHQCNFSLMEIKNMILLPR